MITLKEYWKANKSQIKRNWKQEHIREKHGFYMCKYIRNIVDHIDNQPLLIDMDIADIERELYRSL